VTRVNNFAGVSEGAAKVSKRRDISGNDPTIIAGKTPIPRLIDTRGETGVNVGLGDVKHQFPEAGQKARSPDRGGNPEWLEPTYSTSSGQGTMVDFTVFIAIASATALPMPSAENG
jgi:hypothetical protein